MLAKMGLTAARFDLLHALKRRRIGGMCQATLQRVLGVSRATVSRMLGSLEELGLVRRQMEECDGRKKRVWLTDEGFARIASAYKRLVRSGWVQIAIDSTLGVRNLDALYWGPCFEEMGGLEHLLQLLRRGLLDTGSLHYPFCGKPWGEPRARRASRV
jgi:DNA-binding MarR family transcriptional regulator